MLTLICGWIKHIMVLGAIYIVGSNQDGGQMGTVVRQYNEKITNCSECLVGGYNYQQVVGAIQDGN